MDCRQESRQMRRLQEKSFDELHELAMEAFERPDLTVAEFDDVCQRVMEALQARMDAFDERVAMRLEGLDDSKTTTQRAIEALQRPERFNGEHDVARAWSRNYDPCAGCIFEKVTK